MLCCALLILVLGVFREAWFLLPGRSRSVEGFAPVARRPAPGEPMPAVADFPRERPGRTAGLLVAGSIGTITYAALGYVLLLVGPLEPGSATAPAWVVRDVVLAALALLAAGAAVLAPTVTTPPEPAETRGAWLCGIGAAWWSLGLADLHVFGVVGIGGGLVVDLLFHGAGLALLLAGGALLARRTTTAHPRREVLHA